MNHFEIQGSCNVEGKAWRVNKVFHVVASSAVKAIELVLKDTPNIEVWQLHNRGSITIIEEK